MFKKYFKLYQLTIALSFSLACTIMLNSCKKEKEEPHPTPVIKDFTPTSGIIGATVMINGSNFSATTSENIVDFNGIKATVLASTTTQLTVNVPIGATNGKINVGVNGIKATSNDDFIVIVPPSLTSFSPTSGFAGTTITLTGANFSATPEDNVIKFNGIPATVSSATASQLIVTVPKGASTGKLTISVKGQTITSTDDFTVITSTITSISPASGIVGSTVTIIGTNFSATPAENVVKFNGTASTVTAATTTQLTVTVPSGATLGKITIDLKGQTLTSLDDFTITQPLAIVSFTPTTGVNENTVTITGTNFSSVAADNIVKFNGVSAIVSMATSTTLTTSVPDGATTGKISVTINGNSATSATDFIVPAPTVSGFSPTYGLPGATITITGTNFSINSLTSNRLKLNGTEAVITSVTETQITSTVPSGASTGKITVDVGGQIATSTNDFEVLKDIPRDGLVAFYPFKGNANDASGNNLNGTVNGGASLSTDRFGKSNQSYSLDGVNGNINMANPTLLQISNKITVAGWVNITAFKSPPNPGSSSMAIITKLYFDPAAGGNPRKGYYIDQDFFGGGTPSLNCYIYSSSGTTVTSYLGDYVTSSTESVTIDNWIFFAMVIEDKNMKFYKNGVLTKDDSGASNLMDDGSLGSLIIGSYGGGFFLNGKVDDVTVYNRPLSSPEIQKLYNQTITKY